MSANIEISSALDILQSRLKEKVQKECGSVVKDIEECLGLFVLITKSVNLDNKRQNEPNQKKEGVGKKKGVFLSKTAIKDIEECLSFLHLIRESANLNVQRLEASIDNELSKLRQHLIIENSFLSYDELIGDRQGEENASDVDFNHSSQEDEMNYDDFMNNNIVAKSNNPLLQCNLENASEIKPEIHNPNDKSCNEDSVAKEKLVEQDENSDLVKSNYKKERPNENGFNELNENKMHEDEKRYEEKGIKKAIQNFITKTNDSLSAFKKIGFSEGKEQSHVTNKQTNHADIEGIDSRESRTEIGNDINLLEYKQPKKVKFSSNLNDPSSGTTDQFVHATCKEAQNLGDETILESKLTQQNSNIKELEDEFEKLHRTLSTEVDDYMSEVKAPKKRKKLSITFVHDDFVPRILEIDEYMQPILESSYQQVEPSTFAYECNKCAYKTLHKMELTRHYEALHELKDLHRKGFKCGKCNIKFENERLLEIHMRKHGNTHEYKCKLCYYKSYRISSLKSHVANTHKKLSQHI